MAASVLLNEPTKEDLEREKLRIEIAQLKAPWWRRPNFLLAALPTLLAIVSVFYGLSSGYFQALSTKLENQRHDLERDIQTFSAQKQALQTEIAALRAEIDATKKELEGSSRDTSYHAYLVERARDRVRKLEDELRSRSIPVPPER